MRNSRAFVLVPSLLLAWLAPAHAQETTAERTGYRATSRYADVIDFLDSLSRTTGDLRRGTLAVTSEGREVPYVLLSRPLVSDPDEAARSGKPIVYLQANIHGGEVEGKEVAQMLLRDLVNGSLRTVLEHLVLLVVPIYNVDGNESVAPGSENRPGQNGPAEVGIRNNGQGFDLNRDYIKMEAPETRGAARLINQWDPDFFIDLHTTNGSYHGYSLTYSPGLNPNGSAANDYIRSEFLPAIRTRVRERYGDEIYWYGNFKNQDPDSLDQGWYTYDARPRYGTNWFGLRGRMAILSEGYSNASFAERVTATYRFVREILVLASESRERIASLRFQADGWRPDSIALQAEFAAPVVEPVVAEITLPAGDGAGPFARRTRTGEYRVISMPVYHRFRGRLVIPRPAGYLLPPHLHDVVDLLERQGIKFVRLDTPWHGTVDVFQVDSVTAAQRPFQGHRTRRMAGRWQTQEEIVDAGWYFVDANQRLGTLAVYLLEPLAADGLVTWNFVDEDLVAGRAYPVWRVPRPGPASTTDLPGNS